MTIAFQIPARPLGEGARRGASARREAGPVASSFACSIRRLRHEQEYDDGEFREREKVISDREISFLGRAYGPSR